MECDIACSGCGGASATRRAPVLQLTQLAKGAFTLLRGNPSLRSRFLLLAALVSTALAAQAPVSTEDVSSPEAVVRALYETVQRAPGTTYQWDRFRTLFLSTARLMPNTEQTRGETVTMTVDEFIHRVDRGTVIGGAQDRGFAEEEVHSIVERYGDIAHAFSTYQKRFWKDERILGRGINTVQMVFRGGRWWITSMAWDEETGAGPLPERYRQKP